MQQHISSTEPKQDTFCDSCQNTKLVEVVTGDKILPVAFLGCPMCKKPNVWELPTYTPEFEIVSRWDRWRPSESYNFDQLQEKFVQQAKASKRFFKVDQGIESAKP